MDAGLFDERELFARIASSGARTLLIGRRALVALGLPVMTADYDLWIARDDAAKLNAALAPLGLVPNRSPERARQVGRYVLENSERVDVLVARSAATVDGIQVSFEELWEARSELDLYEGISIGLPSIPHLILTKQFAARPHDIEDVRMLRALLGEGDS
jgi:hypothetical protein